MWYLQKLGTQDPLELELQAAVSYQAQVLGIRLGFPARTEDALGLRAIYLPSTCLPFSRLRKPLLLFSSQNGMGILEITDNAYLRMPVLLLNTWGERRRAEQAQEKCE